MTNGSLITILVLSVLLAFGAGFGTAVVAIPAKTVQVGPPSAAGSSVQLPDGRIVSAPAGSALRIYSQEPSQGTITRDRLGISQGGYARGTSSMLTGATQVGAPDLNMTEGQEEGIGGAINSKMKFAAKNSTSALVWVGIALIVAGILCWILLKMTTLGLSLVVAGGVLIAVGLLVQTYPWVLLVAFVVVLGIIGYFLYRAWKNGQIQAALTNIVKGVEKAPADAAALVKASIDGVGNDKTRQVTKNVVSSIKRSL